ncbi:hypothetical protein KPB02_02965 [Burkholderia cenocepacia]|uniref:hypothetical protein n=1 Tax=Burkholderia cenocepacia TaxID=95486 RepID=UPI00286741A1|nr:hypothetical protein [Burkholderia cenocepacia]MDR8025716.1 hypothetical protein [Burkholderia cenocepacia]
MRLNEKPGLCRVFCLRLRLDDRKRLFRGGARRQALRFELTAGGRVDSDHPITDHRSPITDYRSPITDHRSPITDHRSPITDHRSPITDPPIHRSTDPPIHRSTDPPTHRPTDPPTR